MAAGFANHYGADVLRASSAGLSPVPGVAPHTVYVMEEMNIDLSTHVPQKYDPFDAMQYDIVINMAGFRLPGPVPKRLIEWEITDPYGSSIETYRKARNDLEQRVMRLILDLRRQSNKRK